MSEIEQDRKYSYIYILLRNLPCLASSSSLLLDSFKSIISPTYSMTKSPAFMPCFALNPNPPHEVLNFSIKAY